MRTFKNIVNIANSVVSIVLQTASATLGTTDGHGSNFSVRLPFGTEGTALHYPIPRGMEDCEESDLNNTLFLWRTPWNTSLEIFGTFWRTS